MILFCQGTRQGSAGLELKGRLHSLRLLSVQEGQEKGSLGPHRYCHKVCAVTSGCAQINQGRNPVRNCIYIQQAMFQNNFLLKVSCFEVTPIVTHVHDMDILTYSQLLSGTPTSEIGS
eukprot:g82091.t1